MIINIVMTESRLLLTLLHAMVLLQVDLVEVQEVLKASISTGKTTKRLPSADEVSAAFHATDDLVRDASFDPFKVRWACLYTVWLTWCAWSQ